MEYKLAKTIEDSNYIIRVYRPIISEDERKKRMQAIYKSAERLLKGVYAR